MQVAGSMYFIYSLSLLVCIEVLKVNGSDEKTVIQEVLSSLNSLQEQLRNGDLYAYLARYQEPSQIRKETMENKLFKEDQKMKDYVKKIMEDLAENEREVAKISPNSLKDSRGE